MRLQTSILDLLFVLLLVIVDIREVFVVVVKEIQSLPLMAENSCTHQALLEIWLLFHTLCYRLTVLLA